METEELDSTGLTVEQIDLLKSAVPVLRTCMLLLVERMYSSLFRENPQVRGMFSLQFYRPGGSESGGSSGIHSLADSRANSVKRNKTPPGLDDDVAGSMDTCPFSTAPSASVLSTSNVTSPSLQERRGPTSSCPLTPGGTPRPAFVTTGLSSGCTVSGNAIVLADTLLSIISHLDDLTPLLASITRIGKIHVSRGVLAAHYDVLEPHFLDAAESVLREKNMHSEAVMLALISAYEALKGIMVDEEKKIRADLKQAGAWDGLRTFVVERMESGRDSTYIELRPLDGLCCVPYRPGEVVTLSMDTPECGKITRSFMMAGKVGSVDSYGIRIQREHFHQNLPMDNRTLLENLEVGSHCDLSCPYGGFLQERKSNTNRSRRVLPPSLLPAESLLPRSGSSSATMGVGDSTSYLEMGGEMAPRSGSAGSSLGGKQDAGTSPRGDRAGESESPRGNRAGAGTKNLRFGALSQDRLHPMARTAPVNSSSFQ
ncbi:Flavohemoprotein [Porphyridium purpureum]|uniref:Flavohemoprotein n=1 Tax=Porphyridium purpureum TaxID=35688 RepID=A0A5J4Z5W1_PORPP|nr:Flavohemoprotein [Porphyridium purpureum]|eukprot:POR7222..scf295_1